MLFKASFEGIYFSACMYKTGLGIGWLWLHATLLKSRVYWRRFKFRYGYFLLSIFLSLSAWKITNDELPTCLKWHHFMPHCSLLHCFGQGINPKPWSIGPLWQQFPDECKSWSQCPGCVPAGSHFTQWQDPLVFSLTSVGTETEHCKVLLIPRAICMQHL